MRYSRAAAAPKTITAWSFSRYSTYKQCPARAKYLYIDKLKEPGSPALERGAAIHDHAEKYIKGLSAARLPVELAAFAAEFKRLRAQYKKKVNGMIVEGQWALTREWDETAWNDWARCWARIKVDCADHIDPVTLRVRDWKTGKFRQELNDDYMEQLELYALGALVLHQHLELVQVELVYLDEARVYPEQPLHYARADVPKLKKLWEKRVAPMLRDARFAPKPNDKCRWCHFSKAKGGPCQF